VEGFSPATGSAPASDRQWMAIASLALGVFNMCAWLIPLCGCPLGIVGVVLGVLGRDTDRRTLAYAGIGLSAFTLLLTLVNSAAGLYLGMTGQLDTILQQLQTAP